MYAVSPPSPRPLASVERPRRYDISNFPVFVVRSHNWALAPWVQLARQHRQLTLLSLDHHTDSMDPFVRHCCYGGRDRTQVEAAIRLELDAVDIQDDASVTLAARKLAHDEQIKAATRLGVFQAAFVINFQVHQDSPASEEQAAQARHWQWQEIPYRHQNKLPNPVLPPRPYQYPADPDNVYIVGSALCVHGCKKMPHDSDCERLLGDAAIDRVLLDRQLAVADEMAKTALGWNSCLERPYILDLDLDYFHTRKAVAPPDPSRFYALIGGAVGMTIATEPQCVKGMCLKGEDLTAKWLLPRVLEHVRLARG